MTLEKIEYGSLAKSSTLNNNFDYLDTRISDLAFLVATLQSNMSSIGVNANAQLEAKAKEITSNVEALKKELQNEITGIDEAVNKALSNNGMYVTTHTSGNNWYREYFSDASKTKRVWLEQGGGISTDNGTITLLKPFTNTDYTCLCVTSYSRINETFYIDNKTTTTFHVRYANGGSWFACGK